ncbi:hypothetical protein EFZ10_13085 [Tatumella sp. TA1]|nr:hypothetical protein EFZ10_13085 [Tatumella sp. TA1]
MKTSSIPSLKMAWTVKELNFVEANCGLLTAAEIGLRLGRSTSSVRSMIHRLGCGNQTHTAWTDVEKEILLVHYAGGADIREVMTMLPGRTQKSIESMACKLNIIRRQWLEEENAILQQYYATEGYGVVSRLPGRTASAVANRAFALGLKCVRRGRWSQKELALLQKNLHLDVPELDFLFPDRSRMALWHMRTRLIRLASGQ